MQSTNWTNLKSAFVSAVLMAILAVASYVIGVGNIFSLNGHTVINIGAISLLTGVVSYIKNSLTTVQGSFAGIQVK